MAVRLIRATIRTALSIPRACRTPDACCERASNEVRISPRSGHDCSTLANEASATGTKAVSKIETAEFTPDVIVGFIAGSQVVDKKTG